nr:MAG TPA: hypothetical protein [Caudoviricetes sp.]
MRNGHEKGRLFAAQILNSINKQCAHPIGRSSEIALPVGHCAYRNAKPFSHCLLSQSGSNTRGLYIGICHENHFLSFKSLIIDRITSAANSTIKTQSITESECRSITLRITNKTRKIFKSSCIIL